MMLPRPVGNRSGLSAGHNVGHTGRHEVAPRAGPGAALELEGVGWTPLGRRTPVLAEVNLRLEPGERVLLAGPSGAGKSTLLRAIAGVLESTETGTLVGRIRIDGELNMTALGRVGLMLQDPAEARVAGRVGRDVAFGAENAGMPPAQIHRRVAEALEVVGFPYGPQHPTSALSGGQAQRLALAGVLALRPGLLLLDEPTAMLDQEAAAQVRAAVACAVEATGASLIVVEHQLQDWPNLVDRLVVLGPTGSVQADGPVRTVLEQDGPALASRYGVWVPNVPDPTPLDVPAQLCTPHRDSVVGIGTGTVPVDTPLISALGVGLVRRPSRGLSLGRTPRPDVLALAGVDAQVRAGRLHALSGPSGAGKSSLLGLLTGLEAPTSGQIRAEPAFARGLPPAVHTWRSVNLAERLGWVPQRAEACVVGRSVLDSAEVTAVRLGRDARGSRRRVVELLDALGLAVHLGENPYRLSGGEQRRLALVSALVHGPDLLALDEPTVGQDRLTWSAVCGVLLAARAAGVGLVAATHDPRLMLCADEVTRLSTGRAVTT